jgi:hypothetical protein
MVEISPTPPAAAATITNNYTFQANSNPIFVITGEDDASLFKILEGARGSTRSAPSLEDAIRTAVPPSFEKAPLSASPLPRSIENLSATDKNSSSSRSTSEVGKSGASRGGSEVDLTKVAEKLSTNCDRTQNPPSSRSSSVVGKK